MIKHLNNRIDTNNIPYINLHKVANCEKTLFNSG